MSLSHLLLQLVVILSCSGLLGMLLRAVGQPAVIGEMIAGFALGPVVFGAIAPGLHGALFSPASLPPLEGLAQVGLVLFTFVVGAELRLPHGARKQLVDAMAVGVPSVIVPFVLGLGVAFTLHPALAPPGVSFGAFAFFLASALSVSALPVMARILRERALLNSAAGRLALTAAAVADLMVWVLIAMLLVVVGAEREWYRLAILASGLAVLTCAVFFVARPLVARSLQRHPETGRQSGPLLAALLVSMLACAYATEALGVHAVLGAFLFGIALPRNDRLSEALVDRVEHFTVAALLPVFFVLAGLRTTADAFAGTGPGLGAVALILAVAIGSKLVAALPGARRAGLSWRGSLAVGALMNTRGLMELVVLKVGLDLGLIGAEVFTMLIAMAIVTTLMTGPLLALITRTEPLDR